MTKRTTIEIDEDLLDRAKRLLNLRTNRDTIEESLRRVVTEMEDEARSEEKRQVAFLEQLPVLVDVDILSSGEMWR